MSGFSAASLPTLDFDFTGFPRDDGQEGNCTGKGVIPEPSEERLKAFGEAVSKLSDIGEFVQLAKTAGDDPEKIEAAKKLGESFTESAASIKDDLKLALVELGNGALTIEHLEELPPRVLGFFFRWLVEELLLPKG